jgi:hypothetical protein
MEYGLLVRLLDMAILNRHRITEGVLSVGSIGVLVAAMAAIDETFRGQLLGMLNGESSTQLALAGVGLQRATRMVMETVGDYRAVHSPLMFFVLAAGALFLLMLRP